MVEQEQSAAGGGGAIARAPTQIGKYQLLAELGRGACGVVFKGFDPFVQRDVAVKVALHDPDADDAAHERGFFAEARAAGMLQHPHIVALYDAGVEAELSYLVMEYVDGETLQPLCRPGARRAPLAQVLDIVFKCAKALDYAHGKGVLHRDIKPGNIMLTREGVPKLMDFSIAEITGRTSAGGQGVLGSPLYMSPEQITRARLGPASDLYALGAVMFQLLVGTPPFTDAELPLLFRAIRHTPAPRVRDLRPEVPEAVSDVVERLLLKDPAQRFQSGHELAATLSRLFDQLRLSDHQVTRRESRDSLRRLRFFSTFSDDEIDEILAVSQMATYNPGDALIREGEIDNAFFILALGSAEVRKRGKLLHQLEKGDCVGEIGFLSTTKRTATVVATTRVLALKVNATLLDDMSRDCQLRFYKVFAETLIYRLSVTSARLSALS
ncbi:serine/threonine-protein kinase [Solimonas soli]|uniref:serine/threonine-protein kinase n=1 Tax=Solimonas soli TaxID=413479 RepID=UPI0004AC824D|nr:serine/threonine-protein kinase [Solimonas soli]